MKIKKIIIFGIILIISIVACYQLGRADGLNFINEKWLALRVNLKTGTYTFGGPRGDEIAPGPIEADCINRLMLFTTKYNVKCKLIDAVDSKDESMCKSVGGMSVQGCAICKIECN